MKKYSRMVSMVLALMLVLASAAVPSLATAGPGDENIVPVLPPAEERVGRFLTSAEWAALDATHQLTNASPNIMSLPPISVEDIDRGWTSEDWERLDAVKENASFDASVNGTQLLLRGSSTPTSFYDINKSVYSTYLRDIGFMQTFYTDDYFGSGPKNKIYLQGSVHLSDGDESSDIYLELYEYSPNFGVYGTKVSFKYQDSIDDGSGELKAHYVLDTSIVNLQPNNLYYLKFVNGSGRTVTTGWIDVSGSSL